MLFGLLSSFVILLFSQVLEWIINRELRPDAEEWTWISEVAVAAGFFVMAVLWIHLKQTREALSALERERVVIDTQLSIAAQVQQALLPAIPPPSDRIEWFGITQPAGKVGGDYFDFLPLPEGRMCVALADVSGKGIAAAIFLSNVRAVLHTLIRETTEPRLLAQRLSETLEQDANGGLYVSAIIAVVDPARDQLTYTNIGHPYGLVLSHAKPARPLTVGGPPAGLIPGITYEQETLTLGGQDLVVFMSDGITESLDSSGLTIETALPAVFAGLTEVNPYLACHRLLEAASHGPGPRGVKNWSDDRTVVAFGGRLAVGVPA
jgi:serine phosphatase RsbU (regulator of sigma subunit)